MYNWKDTEKVSKDQNYEIYIYFFSPSSKYLFILWFIIDFSYVKIYK